MLLLLISNSLCSSHCCHRLCIIHTKIRIWAQFEFDCCVALIILTFVSPTQRLWKIFSFLHSSLTPSPPSPLLIALFISFSSTIAPLSIVIVAMGKRYYPWHLLSANLFLHLSSISCSSFVPFPSCLGPKHVNTMPSCTLFLFLSCSKIYFYSPTTLFTLSLLFILCSHFSLLPQPSNCMFTH